MAEVGLDLRVKGGKIVLTYRGKEYDIKSSPQEPCTYIYDGDTLVHTLRVAFETSEIEKMSEEEVASMCYCSEMG